MEALLDSGATELVMSSEFARKQSFKLKKLIKIAEDGLSFYFYFLFYFIFPFYFQSIFYF